jgi:hypothetical protein
MMNPAEDSMVEPSPKNEVKSEASGSIQETKMLSDID